MYNVNKHIKKKLLNEFSGSEKKETLIMDDGFKYMVKKPDPTRELNRKEVLSYINNVFSEYIGCNIAKLIGLEAQETKLGEYTIPNRNNEDVLKIVCLCKDVRKDDENMLEFDTISLSSDENKDIASFTFAENIISHIKKDANLTDANEKELQDFYYKLFIFDAFIGNTDRHNGNVAILENKEGDFTRISPIYDCGSCLLSLLDDTELNNDNIASLMLSVNSCLLDENDNVIRYNDYLLNIRNSKVDNALLELICNINLNDINSMIDNADYISDVRKNFYKDMLELRYNRVLINSIEKILPIDKDLKIADNINLYDVYLRNIKPIAELNSFENVKLTYNNQSLDVMRVNKKYALCSKDGKCVGLLPIRSNNDEIRKAIAYLGSFGIDICNADIKIVSSSETFVSADNLDTICIEPSKINSKGKGKEKNGITIR